MLFKAKKDDNLSKAHVASSLVRVQPTRIESDHLHNKNTQFEFSRPSGAIFRPAEYIVAESLFAPVIVSKFVLPEYSDYAKVHSA
jgi:hypothetical protein